MKKIFILSMIISFAMICSCQKQDSAAEQELAQRKTELDARETALNERINALDEKVKALDERVKFVRRKRKIRGKCPDNSYRRSVAARFATKHRPKLKETEDTRAFAPRFGPGCPTPRAKVTAEKTRQSKRDSPHDSLGRKNYRRQKEGKLNKAKMFGEAVFPAAAARLLSRDYGANSISCGGG